MEKGEDIEELEEDWIVSDVIESTSSSEEHGMYINLLSDWNATHNSQNYLVNF